MTDHCADLDEFFDGELAADRADAFRIHLPSCERCQGVLLGRMQESMAVRAPVRRPVPLPVAVARGSVEGAAPPPAVVPGPAAMAPGRSVAAGRFRRWHRTIAYAAAPVLAAAAAIPLLCGAESGLQLAVALDRGPATDRGTAPAAPRRGLAAHTGDVLRSSVQGERHQALWVFLDERELIVRCPEDERCRSAGGELALELPLTTRGQYAIIAAGSSEALPAPGATLDTALAAARTAGVRTQVKYVDVD